MESTTLSFPFSMPFSKSITSPNNIIKSIISPTRNTSQLIAVKITDSNL